MINFASLFFGLSLSLFLNVKFIISYFEVSPEWGKFWRILGTIIFCVFVFIKSQNLAEVQVSLQDIQDKGLVKINQMDGNFSFFLSFPVNFINLTPNNHIGTFSAISDRTNSFIIL